MLRNVEIIGKCRGRATFILAFTDQRIIVEQEFQPENNRVDLVNLGRIENKNHILIGQSKNAPGDIRNNFFECGNCRADMMITAVKRLQLGKMHMDRPHAILATFKTTHIIDQKGFG